MAKMGISTLRSYKGAQIADAIGLSKERLLLIIGGHAACGKLQDEWVPGSSVKCVNLKLNHAWQTLHLLPGGGGNVLHWHCKSAERFGI